MTGPFDELKLPPSLLSSRKDAAWEMSEQGQEHRVAVLRALQASVHDALVARAIHRREHGADAEDSPELHAEFWTPLWDGLRASLTRQDLLRWLVDWATQSQQEKALGTVVRMHEELDMLDDASGSWWLTENPG